MPEQPELSVADFFKFGNDAATHTAVLTRWLRDGAQAPDQRSETAAGKETGETNAQAPD